MKRFISWVRVHHFGVCTILFLISLIFSWYCIIILTITNDVIYLVSGVLGIVVTISFLYLATNDWS